MCTVHHLNVCTDVYLQGSWLRNEKIAGSCLLTDVKAVSCAFSCIAFTQERSEHDGGQFHWRKMSTHALQKMTRDLFRAMSLAPRQKCPRNVVEMKEAMAAFFGSDSVAISCHCKRSKIILVKVLT